MSFLVGSCLSANQTARLASAGRRGNDWVLPTSANRLVATLFEWGYAIFMPDIESKILIEPFRNHHWLGFWPIFSEIVAAQETYAYDEGLSQEEARRLWIEQPPGCTVVAVDGNGTVLGSAKMGPNRQGPGAHVATASFMVGSANRGCGVGRLLGEHALDWARAEGFRSMQFNAVVETNEGAVQLWQKLGFEIVGRVPEAFAHPKHGFVALLIMHRYL